MGYVYEDGKEYPRAGVYRRSSNGNVNNTVASALDGIGALPIKSDWGPLNEVTLHAKGTADVTMKNTYGTGCFLLMNTGKKKVDSKSNLLSGIAWGVGDEITYSLEGSAFNAGSVIKWLRDEVELIKTARECDIYAEQVEDSNGLYFVPAFTGLGAPYWDMYARGIMVGLTRGVNKKHICRAVLESITYQMTDLLEAMMKDSGIVLKDLRVDGGASVSDIMMQIQADMTGVNVNRPKNVETTALGAAYCAGLATGVWDSLEEIEANRAVDKIFVPSMEITKRNEKYSDWKRAVERSRNWER